MTQVVQENASLIGVNPEVLVQTLTHEKLCQGDPRTHVEWNESSCIINLENSR